MSKQHFDAATCVRAEEKRKLNEEQKKIPIDPTRRFGPHRLDDCFAQLRIPGFSAEPLTKSRYGVWSCSTVREPRFFPVSKKEARVWYQRARAWDRRTKAKRRHGGGIGLPAMKVLEAFHFDFLNFASGRLDPSYEGIARRTGLVRSTVAKALAKQKELGIIAWLRRAAHAYVDGVFTLRQRTNAYAILPPSQWRGYVDPDDYPGPPPEAWGAIPPLPSLLEQAAATARDGASLGARAGLLDADPDDKLAQSLARLAQSMAERTP